MEKNTYIPLSYNTFGEWINRLVSESSKLKANIFRKIIMEKEINEREVKLYESHINEFLRQWTEIMEKLVDAVGDVDKIPENLNFKAIPYEDVKSFIYEENDYASVLQFTDGLLTGIKDKKFIDPEDIEDFKDHTLSMAFKNGSENISELLASVENLKEYSVNSLEKKLFNNVKGYKNLLNRRDRAELYKAITKTVEYITKNRIIDYDLTYKNVKLYISFVNNVVEYMTYSLSAYATRIYAIHRYVKNYIDTQNVGSIDESTTLMDISENPNGSISSVFHGTDETIYRDPSKAEEFFERFAEFIRLIGADVLFTDKETNNPQQQKIPTYKHQLGFYKLRENNRIYEKLQENPLYKIESYSSNIMELHNNLKTALYNKYQGHQGPTTSRNEFLHTIRGITYGESVKDYQTLARDLYLVALETNSAIINAIDKLSDDFRYTSASKDIMSRKHFIQECTSFLSEWYGECMHIFAQKTYFIERKINELRASESKKILDIVSLDVPGWKSDTCMNNMMMTSVPDTTRMPLEMMDLYTIPVFEEYEMYDEYLRSLPEFKNDLYLSEANVSSIVNTIISFLKGIFNNINIFDKKCIEAVQWTKNHKDKLAAINYATIKMTADDNVHDYNLNLNPNDTNGPLGHFKNVATMITNINPNDLKDEGKLKEFIQKLYYPKTYEWYEGEKGDAKTATTRFNNIILYGKTADEAMAIKDEPKPLVLDGKAIKIRLLGGEGRPGWVQDIINQREITGRVNSINKELLNAMNSLKNKAITESTLFEDTTLTGTGDNSTTNQQEVKEKSGQGLQIFGKIQVVINNQWKPLVDGCIMVLKSEYKYIQAVYDASMNASAVNKPVITNDQK